MFRTHKTHSQNNSKTTCSQNHHLSLILFDAAVVFTLAKDDLLFQHHNQPAHRSTTINRRRACREMQSIRRGFKLFYVPPKPHDRTASSMNAFL
jgi:hypothetical protein